MSHTFVRNSIVLLLALTIALAEASPAHAADGSLDPTFGNGGFVTTDMGGNDNLGLDVAVQPDAKILVAGTSMNAAATDNDFGLARHNTDGSPDVTFDGDGKVSTDITNGYDAASGIALQADGKIIAAGYANTGNDIDFALVRYNPDGSLDITFDLDGKVTTPLSSSADYGMDVLVQPDGKILMTGFSHDDPVLVNGVSLHWRAITAMVCWMRRLGSTARLPHPFLSTMPMVTLPHSRRMAGSSLPDNISCLT